MTEEPDSPTRTMATEIAAAAVLAVAGLGAYVYEHARAGAYSAHFGVAFVAADPRRATVPLAAFAVLATVVLLAAWVSTRAPEIALPGAVAAVGAGTLALVPLGFSARDAATMQASVIVIVLVLRWTWPAMRASVPGLPRAGAAAARISVTLKPPPLFLLLAAALAVVIASWRLGSYAGRVEAGAKTDFDVVRRDASAATVIFTRTGDIVERVLDVSPGADGKPRNVWLPGVVIRPMPETGIRYETVRLGPTRPSDVAQP